MKKREKTKLLALLVLSTAWLCIGITSATAGEGLKAPETELIIEGEKKSAKFSHPVHLKLALACGVCHHGSEHQPLTDKDIAAMENSLQLQCTSCHDKDFADPELQTLKAVFHGRCKECHKQGIDGKKGPTKCTGCHVKK